MKDCIFKELLYKAIGVANKKLEGGILIVGKRGKLKELLRCTSSHYTGIVDINTSLKITDLSIYEFTSLVSPEGATFITPQGEILARALDVRGKTSLLSFLLSLLESLAKKQKIKIGTGGTKHKAARELSKYLKEEGFIMSISAEERITLYHNGNEYSIEKYFKL